jgi:signal transduction histidine kinase
VPDGASKVQLLLVSGGTPRTTGFWAVRRLRLEVADDAAGRFAPLYTLDQLEGTNLGSPRGIPRGWLRDGTELTTPQIYTDRDSSEPRPMLALVDVQPENTGGWLLQTREVIPVRPGQHLRFACDEIYSIGRGGDARVIHRTLPVGDYVFRARATDELGRPAGPELRLPIQVLPPFYATTWFQLAAFAAALAALAAIVRYATWRKVQRELRRLEAQRAIEEERTRIARDIHDEMGARLTQISILARRLAPAGEKENGTRAAAHQLQTVSRDLATALDEIVWAADPRLDTLESLGHYLSQYAGTIVRDAGLRCRLDIAPLLPDRILSSGTRHRLMMAAKEALTNALKHARATEIRVRLAVTDERLEIAVGDNGTGFDPAAVRHGNGLENLRRRLEEMGGTCDLRTQPGRGTTVTLRLPLGAAEVAS